MDHLYSPHRQERQRIGEQEVGDILNDLLDLGTDRSILDKLWSAYTTEIPGLPREVQLSSTTESREKILLWLCIRRRALEGDSADLENLRSLTAKIFSKKELPRATNTEESPKPEIANSDKTRVLCILYALYPEQADEVIGEFLGLEPAEQANVTKGLLRQIATERGIAGEENSVPYTRINLNIDSAGQGKIVKIARKYGFTIRTVPLAGTVKDGNQKYIVMTSAVSQKTFFHELNHVAYPNMKVGSLGVGINEAITDLLAVRKVDQEAGMVQTLLSKVTSERRRVYAVSGYRTELDMFYELVDRIPDLQELLLRRYTTDSKENSNQLMSALLSNLGISGLLELYRVVPQDKKSSVTIHAKDFLVSYRAWRRKLDQKRQKE